MFCDIATVGTGLLPGSVPPGENNIRQPAEISSDGSDWFCQRTRRSRPASSAPQDRLSSQSSFGSLAKVLAQLHTVTRSIPWDAGSADESKRERWVMPPPCRMFDASIPRLNLNCYISETCCMKPRKDSSREWSEGVPQHIRGTSADTA